MKTLEAAGLRFGEGLPKICVPLTESTLPALEAEAKAVRDLPADLYEWRVDSFAEDVGAALTMLTEAFAPKPLLCTLRTQAEGGLSPLEGEAYENFLCNLLEHGGFQLLDVEFCHSPERVGRIRAQAQKRGVALVLSKHDFARTPPEDEIVSALTAMARTGSCLPKFAVTPQSPEDVLTLLSATRRASKEVGPVITMAMGSLGKVTRVCGQVFGSCMTFGAGKNASAPGQIGAAQLRSMMEALKGEVL